MHQSHLAALDRLLSTQRTQIHEKWVAEILTSWSTLLPNTFDVVEVRQHTSHLLEEIAKIFSAYPGYGLWEFGETHPLVRIMSEFSASRAIAGFTPTETAQYVMCLKSVLTLALIRELMASPTEMELNLAAVEDAPMASLYGLAPRSIPTVRTTAEEQARKIVRLSRPKGKAGQRKKQRR